MLVIPRGLIDEIDAVASRDEEGACAFLVGRGGLDRKIARAVRPGRFYVGPGSSGPYQVHPGDLLEVDRAARADGENVIAFALVTPDGEAQVEHVKSAMEGFSYLLLRREGDQVAGRRSFERDLDSFDEEEVVVE